MLSKMQKIWLGIFASMFLIPEILWGNLFKIFRISFLPIYRDIQYFIDNPLVAFIIIIIEIIGISGIVYLLNKKLKTSKLIKYISNIFLVIILFLLVVSLYFSFVMTQINF